MKVGAENRKKVIALCVLMGLAALLLIRSLFSSGSPTPTTSVAGPAALPPVATRPMGRGRAGAKKRFTPPHSLDPSLREDWLQASEETKYQGNGRNIFKAQAEIPQPLGPAVTDKDEAETGPPQPPPPPPITLRFYGFASKPGEPKKIFLSQGEDVFIASEGEIIDRRYRIVHILPTSVEIEDVLNNNRQNIPLTQG